MKISEYLGLIGLNDNSIDTKKITEILEYIASLDADEINSNTENIAKLFCRTISKIEQKNVPQSISKSIISAFKNINTMTIGNTDSSELKTIEFLQQLYSNNDSYVIEYNDKAVHDFNELIENLDKINIVFTLRDDEQKEFFPISRLISNVLSTIENKKNLNDAKVMQTLMLALQIFKKDHDTELNKLNEFIKKYNLVFAEHLLNGYEKIGGDLWLSNYEKNGVLILYSEIDSKIYIRNIEKTYFEGVDIINKTIECERNEKDESIAYFVEFDVDILKFTNYFEELKSAKSKDEIDTLFDIAVNKDIYNVFIDQSLYIDRDGVIKPINPYTKKDKFIIVGNNELESEFSNLCDQIKSLGLKHYIGCGINYVNIGMIYSLAKIKKFDIRQFEFSDGSSYFNQLLKQWIDSCGHDLELFKMFLKEYVEKLEYLHEPKQLIEKQYNDDFFLPYQINLDLLDLFNINGFDMNTLKECNFEVDKYGEHIIKDSNGDDISDFEIKNNSEIDLNNGEELFVSIDYNSKIVTIDDQIKNIGRLRKKINEINSITLDFELISVVTEIDLGIIKGYMKLHSASLQEVHNNMELSSIARYRLAHHIVANDFTRENFRKWMSLIKKHDELDYSIIKKSEKFNVNTEGVLYVLKDRSSRETVFKDINNNYIKKITERGAIDLYDYSSNLEFSEDGKVLLNKNEIKKICFVFDLVQTGTATKKVLDQYLDPDFKEKYTNNCRDNNDNNDNYNNRIVYMIGSNIIDINTILTLNTDVKISVYIIYCSEVGRQNITKYFETNTNFDEILFEEEITHVIDKEEINLIKKIYGYSNKNIPIKCGNSLVIREFSQPKRNIFSVEFLNASNVCSLFVNRPEKA